MKIFVRLSVFSLIITGFCIGTEGDFSTVLYEETSIDNYSTTLIGKDLYLTDNNTTTISSGPGPGLIRFIKFWSYVDKTLRERGCITTKNINGRPVDIVDCNCVADVFGIDSYVYKQMCTPPFDIGGIIGY
ncbi:MAG: hypothetical protein HY606_11505 [Planctomycetes bacterium]|nr:hypothetical protein [Planctomycetota bacterium]